MSGGIYRHFSPVMVSAAVFTAAIDLDTFVLLHGFGSPKQLRIVSRI